MRTINFYVIGLVLNTFLCFTPVSHAVMTDEVRALQDEWANIKYQLPEKERETAFAKLAEKAAGVRAAQPANAEALIWEGIILSTYAGAKGGLGALSLAKQARALFEEAIKLDPAAMQGSAYTSLGSLYYQVPSWPVGFGDDDKALEYLQKGLELNPDGIDSNYFYGDYLLNAGKYTEAEAAFSKALQAPPRPGRESADAGRKQEVELGLEKIKSQQLAASKKSSSL